MLKKIFFLILILIYPICGIYSYLILLYNLSLLSTNYINLSLYPEKPGYFESQLTFIIKKQEALSKVDKALNLPEKFDEIHTIKVFHGPWLSSKDFPELKWYQRISPGYISLKIDNSHFPFDKQFVKLRINWFFQLDVETIFNYKSDQILTLFNTNPLLLKKHISFTGDLASWFTDDYLYSKSSLFDLSLSKNLLGLDKPSLNFETEYLGSEAYKLLFHNFILNARVSHHSPKTSLELLAEVDHIYSRSRKFYDLQVYCKLSNAQSKFYNEYQSQFALKTLHAMFGIDNNIWDDFSWDAVLEKLANTRADLLNCTGEYFFESKYTKFFLDVPFPDYQPKLVAIGDPTSVRLGLKRILTNDLYLKVQNELNLYQNDVICSVNLETHQVHVALDQ